MRSRSPAARASGVPQPGARASTHTAYVYTSYMKISVTFGFRTWHVTTCVRAYMMGRVLETCTCARVRIHP